MSLGTSWTRCIKFMFDLIWIMVTSYTTSMMLIFSLSLTTVQESVQYSATLVVTGAWRGTNTDKIYEELGWESLYHRRYYRRMTLFYKIVNEYTREYLRAPINLARVKPYSFRNSNILEPINSRTNRFANSFYPFCAGGHFQSGKINDF